MKSTVVWIVVWNVISWLAGPGTLRGEEGSDEKDFQTLVHEDSLEGWEGDSKWFRVEGGEVIGGSLEREIPHNFFLCTRRSYENFELRLEAKLLGPGDNAGIQFRTAKIPDSHEVSGYQADMGTAWDRPVWGALYDESRRNRMLAEGDREVVAEALRKEDWNAIVIRCEGSRVQIWLNGQRTVDYTEPDPQISRSGVIALQIHGGPPAEARYRKVRIQEL